MTDQELVNITYRRFEGNTDYPESTEEDYLLIRGALNDAIEVWGGRAKVESTKWRELFTELSTATDGDKLTVASQSTYDCPTDFQEMSSFVQVTDTDGGSLYYPFVDADDVMKILKEDASERFYYIIGSEGAYQIVLNPVPTIANYTINYSYYKKASLLTTTTSTIEMSRPYFAIYFALSVLNEDERPDLAAVHSARAKELMDEMVINNEIPPFNHSYKIEDFDFDKNGALGFGRS